MCTEVEYVTFKQASQILACSLASAYRWAQEGKFGLINPNTRQPRKIPLAAVRAFCSPSPQQLKEAQRGVRSGRKRRQCHGQG